MSDKTRQEGKQATRLRMRHLAYEISGPTVLREAKETGPGHGQKPALTKHCPVPGRGPPAGQPGQFQFATAETASQSEGRRAKTAASVA